MSGQHGNDSWFGYLHQVAFASMICGVALGVLAGMNFSHQAGVVFGTIVFAVLFIGAWIVGVSDAA